MKLIKVQTRRRGFNQGSTAFGINIEKFKVSDISLKRNLTTQD